MTNIDLQATLERIKELRKRIHDDDDIEALIEYNRIRVERLFPAFEASMALNEQLVEVMQKIDAQPLWLDSDPLTYADGFRQRYNHIVNLATSTLTAAQAYGIKE